MRRYQRGANLVGTLLISAVTLVFLWQSLGAWLILIAATMIGLLLLLRPRSGAKLSGQIPQRSRRSVKHSALDPALLGAIRRGQASAMPIARQLSAPRPEPSIVHFWQAFDPAVAVNVHPSDLAAVTALRPKSSATALQTALLPVPYMGHLASADIFVMLLNPGYDERDVVWEAEPALRRAKIEELRQQRAGSLYPVMMFDPALSYHAGHGWLRKQFGALFSAELGRRLAVLELFPYHSREFDAQGEKLYRLASVQAMRRYVHEDIVPRCRRGEALLIVGRGARPLGVSAASEIDGSLIVYQGGETRGAYMTPRTRGGQAISAWLDGRPVSASSSNRA